MIINFQSYRCDLSQPLPVGLVYNPDPAATSAWYAPPVQISPVRMGDWVGSVAAGASVNFNQINFNPHANGTHTESVGHIVAEPYPLPSILKEFHHLAQLITLSPQQADNGDFILNAGQLAAAYRSDWNSKALLIRTLPNEENYKTKRNYSHQNPPYLSSEAMRFIVAQGIEHLLIDLPSVDREEDGGELAAHKIFWDYPSLSRAHCSITELFYAPSEIEDGLYLLNLQIAGFDNDACPSYPILYRLQAQD